MLHSLSIAATVTGVAAAVSVACSGSFSPSSDPSAAPSRKSSQDAPRLTPQRSNTANRLQAVSPVNQRVVWASGLGGSFVVTTDGGDTWRAGVVSDNGVPQTQLQFRDVHGVSAKVAYLLAAGEGEASRIYKTTDGGATWTRQFTNDKPLAFYDCFDFWTPNRGVTFSDPGQRPFSGHPHHRRKDLAGYRRPAAAGTAWRVRLRRERHLRLRSGRPAGLDCNWRCGYGEDPRHDRWWRHVEGVCHFHPERSLGRSVQCRLSEPFARPGRWRRSSGGRRSVRQRGSLERRRQNLGAHRPSSAHPGRGLWIELRAQSATAEGACNRSRRHRLVG